MELVCYIHLSPIKAGVVNDAAVSFRLSYSSGLTRTADGLPFLVITISSSVE